jgi:hypothetical protein
MSSEIWLIVFAIASFRVSYAIAIERGFLDVFARFRREVKQTFPVADERDWDALSADDMNDDGTTFRHWIVAGVMCPSCVGVWSSLVFASLFLVSENADALYLTWSIRSIALWFAMSGAVSLLSRAMR